MDRQNSTSIIPSQKKISDGSATVPFIMTTKHSGIKSLSLQASKSSSTGITLMPTFQRK